MNISKLFENEKWTIHELRIVENIPEYIATNKNNNSQLLRLCLKSLCDDIEIIDKIQSKMI